MLKYQFGLNYGHLDCILNISYNIGNKYILN